MIYLVVLCYLWFGGCWLFASCCLAACVCFGDVFVVTCCYDLMLVIWIGWG